MSAIHSILIALVFHLIDMLTGLIGAVKNGEITSSKMRDGFFKKIGFIFCYILAFLIDNYGVQIGFNISVKVLPIIILYTITTEIVSIVENICKINPDLVSTKILKLLHISDKEDDNNAKNN